jgi:hypothetical protein
MTCRHCKRRPVACSRRSGLCALCKALKRQAVAKPAANWRWFREWLENLTKGAA